MVLHDRSMRAVAFGPLDNFFTAVHETSSVPGVLSAGPMATLGVLPPNASFSTMLVPGQGVNTTLYEWGSRILAQSGKIRPDPYVVPNITVPKNM